MTAVIIPFPERRIVRPLFMRYQGDSPEARLVALLREAVEEAEAAKRAKRRKKKD